MSVRRKRIGGGWINVQNVPPESNANDQIPKQETKTNKSGKRGNARKKPDIDQHFEQPSKKDGVNKATDTEKESDINNEHNVGQANKAGFHNEALDTIEHKWQKDEKESEKKGEKISTVGNEMKYANKLSAHENETRNANELEHNDTRPTRNGHVSDGDLTDSSSTNDPFESDVSEKFTKSELGSSDRLPVIHDDESFTFNDSVETYGSSKKSVDAGDYDAHPILRHVQNSVIGQDLVVNTPFGKRIVTYCDFTASGRALSFIEDFIRQNVLPTYANTHSTTGHNARQTGKFREEARNTIKRCVNGSKDDVVIFTGSGATAGIHKVAWALRLNSPRVASETAVFISPYEHHSNILLWRELGTKVVRIRHDYFSGLVDLEQLEDELKFWREKKRHLVVCMSAASNVTGIITDVDAVSRIAHQNGALAIFDYAGGGPYLEVDMNVSRTEYKDAVILSPHKFVGGPGTPGLVVAKKWIFRNPVPDKVGGGTVRYVTRELHSYVGNIEEREEGGTPAIIESIRAGLVFQLKQDIGTDLIHARENTLIRKAFKVWENNPAIFVLGSHIAERVPIFSFLVIHQETGRLIHHNFISSLLSDLYGIQARGGCACAGPYAEDIMGISESTAKKYLHFLSEKDSWKGHHEVIEIMKPGFTRINLPYFYDDRTVDFVIEAVDMVTKYGWKLLPQYSFDVKSGSWFHKSFSNTAASELMSLDHALDGSNSDQSSDSVNKTNSSPSFKEILKSAERLFTEADTLYTRARISSASLTLRKRLPKDTRGLKWFLTPHEAVNILTDTDKSYLDKKPYRLPFKLVKPSFITDLDIDSYDSFKTSTDKNVSNSVSLPPIHNQRGRSVSNSHATNRHNRNRSLQGRVKLSLGESDYESDIEYKRGTHVSHERKVIDAYGTPRRMPKSQHKADHTMQHKQRANHGTDQCLPCTVEHN